MVLICVKFYRITDTSPSATDSYYFTIFTLCISDCVSYAVMYIASYFMLRGRPELW